MWQHATKGRPVRAEIDLAAFRHNLNVVRQMCPQSKVFAVVKADAYGHGIAPISKQIPDTSLAVASIEEAIALRSAGLENPILILEGLFDDGCIAGAREKNFALLVHSHWQLEIIAAASEKKGNLRVWVKVDTGMHRLGFDPETIPSVVQKLTNLPNILLEGIMTHLACADEPDSLSVKQQLAKFDQTTASLSEKSLALSVANSGGILHFPNSHRDWVRPGIMLYGGVPHATRLAQDYGLKAVMSLRSSVIALQELNAGESVGYGHIWTAQKNTLLATVAVGYADGYPRHASNGTPVMVNGEVAALAGRVSMDMITVDVSDLSSVHVGDDVELWGNNVSVDEIARRANTISYELLTGITKRVPRIYLNAG